MSSLYFLFFDILCYFLPRLFPPSRCTFACRVHFTSESIEWLLEDQNFLRSYDAAPSPLPPPLLPSASCVSFSVFVCVAGLAYWLGGGVRKSQIIPPRESLVLYKSLNTLCFSPMHSHTFSFHQLKHTQPIRATHQGVGAISEISVSASDSVSGAAVDPFSISERRNPSMN